jgi:hypothetical protein
MLQLTYSTTRKSRQKLHPVVLPKLVCKQMWNETTSIFFETAVFTMRADNQSFHTFATSPSTQSVVSRVRRLHIHTVLLSPWYTAANATDVGRFQSLQGVEWDVLFYPSNPRLVETPGVMSAPAWKSSKIPLLIQAFQQHKLQKDLTSVAFRLLGRHYFDRGPDTTLLSETVRGLLLEYTPRGTSEADETST